MSMTPNLIVVYARFGAVVLVTLFAAKSAEAAITKGPWVQRVTSTSAVVRVEVDPPAAVSVELGGLPMGVTPVGDAGGEHQVIESAEVHALHAITINNLQPETHYSYLVKVGPTSKLAAFTTAPRDDSDTSFRFLIYGDNRSEDSAHAAIVRAMTPVASDFLLNTGDLVENGASKTQWQTFFEIEAPLLDARPMFTSVGNHELTDGAGIEYARYFGPTEMTPAMMNEPRAKNGPVATRPVELNGTFRWGYARFFLINGTGSYKPGSPDRVWLDKALSDADNEPNLKWRIVAVHHGPFSSGPHGNNARLHDAGIPALFKTHKIDLVVSGHDHIYERGFGDGVAFLVSGGGGAPLYRLKKPIPQSKKAESVRHYIEVSVSPAQLQIATVRTDGSTIERCSLGHSAVGWDCDGGPVSTPNPDGGADLPPVLPPANASDGAPAKSRCGCDVVGASSFAPTWTVFGALTAIATCLRRRRRPSS